MTDISMEDIDKAYEEMMIEYRKYCEHMKKLNGDDVE